MSRRAISKVKASISSSRRCLKISAEISEPRVTRKIGRLLTAGHVFPCGLPVSFFGAGAPCAGAAALAGAAFAITYSSTSHVRISWATSSGCSRAILIAFSCISRRARSSTDICTSTPSSSALRSAASAHGLMLARELLLAQAAASLELAGDEPEDDEGHEHRGETQDRVENRLLEPCERCESVRPLWRIARVVELDGLNGDAVAAVSAVPDGILDERRSPLARSASVTGVYLRITLPSGLNRQIAFVIIDLVPGAVNCDADRDALDAVGLRVLMGCPRIQLVVRGVELVRILPDEVAQVLVGRRRLPLLSREAPRD